MKIFLAGATGVLGRNLLPLLVERGQRVMAMTRSAEKLQMVADEGAEPLLCDVYDPKRLTEEMVRFSPELVIHQLTDLPDDPGEIMGQASKNSRMRREGTANLLSAAATAGCRGFVAQSVAWRLPGDGGDAVKDLEATVLGYGGVVIRYGRLYGPGTYHETQIPDGERIDVRSAARLTVQYLQAPSGIYICAE